MCQNVITVNTCKRKTCKYAHSHEELVQSVPPPVENKYYKTKMCRQILRDKSCKYGDACHFAHSEDDLRVVSDDSDDAPADVDDDASDEAVAPAKTQDDSKIPCDFFWKNKRCRYGKKCRYSHEIGPDSVAEAPAKTNGKK